jgi:hypothetical protein
MNKCRCDERLQTKTKEFTRLPYTGKSKRMRKTGYKFFFSLEKKKKNSIVTLGKTRESGWKQKRVRRKLVARPGTVHIVR